MKVFQIDSNICYWDATRQFPNLSDTLGRFPPEVLFVEAPNNVFEGWGYDPDAEGDARFIQPTPPEGWLYDTGTGTFYPADYTPTPTEQERLEAQVMYTALCTDTLLEDE